MKKEKHYRYRNRGTGHSGSGDLRRQNNRAQGADLHTGYGRVQDIQGFVEDCGAHRFVAGRGGSARSQGTAALHHIYPELNAKLIQAEAVRSAAEAMNKKADKVARQVPSWRPPRACGRRPMPA